MPSRPPKDGDPSILYLMLRHQPQINYVYCSGAIHRNLAPPTGPAFRQANHQHTFVITGPGLIIIDTDRQGNQALKTTIGTLHNMIVAITVLLTQSLLATHEQMIINHADIKIITLHAGHLQADL